MSQKYGIAAIVTGFACAGAAWVISAGSVLAPEPADLKSALAGPNGATAGAVLWKYEPAPVLLWPASWEIGTMAVGTPCSTYALGYGSRPTRRIAAQGSYRACLEYNPYQAPPADAVRPLPPMPMDGGSAKRSTDAVAVKVIGIAVAIFWPANWTEHNSDDGTTPPYPGQPCSNFPLMAGETTHKHIQTSTNQTANHRCVSIKEPIYAAGP
jgi:hypothetical protein